MFKYYALTAEATAEALNSSLEAGLTAGEAAKYLEKFGPNQLKERKGRGPLGIFLEQFYGLIVWILIGAALVSGFLREWIDASAIIIIVGLNAVLGFIQEYRAERAMAALKKLASPTSKVIREGKRELVLSSKLVPGDVVELEAGDNVPADGRLSYVTPNFTVQEASLTGESVPIVKTIHPLEEKEIPLGDRANMVYLGTSVLTGKARGIVVETGMRTELGRIAHLIQAVEKETTPLQKKLEQFGKWIVYLCFVLVAAVFLLELWRGGEMLNVFITSVSLAVAAIPEGLPAVVTIALALGVQRMVRRHALIRKLPSVETLGAATVICSDKTGTLTKNEMTVKKAYAGEVVFEVTGAGYSPAGEFTLNGSKIEISDYPTLKQSLLCGVLCNGAQLIGSQIMGDPTEGAILTAAAKAGLRKEELEKEYPFVEEIPFDPDRKKMTIVRGHGGKYVAFVKGAPDILLRDCAGVDKDRILKVNAELAGEALRVLAMAYRVMDEAPAEYDAGLIEKDLTFLGLVGMIDPPREEVKSAIRECNTAGIKTVMITGDHKDTAEAIAKELGITSVYARVSSEDKLKIVRALKEKGEIVAMTGDGVNDAPAVKEANIGVAMGITGTDVTKEVSDMIVTDDNFASIVAAVEEGRGIYDNIRKFIHYLLSCNIGEILVMFSAALLGMPIPLLPVQILWVNLVTDGLPALALGVDPADPGVMKRPPRLPEVKVVTAERVFLMLGQGGIIAFCSLLAFAYVFFIEKGNVAHSRTAAFIVLCCSQLFHAFNCRSQSRSLFKMGLFTNLRLIMAVGLSFLLTMAVVYIPFLRIIFKTDPLSVYHWVLAIMLSTLPFWAMEAVKTINRKWEFIKDN